MITIYIILGVTLYLISVLYVGWYISKLYSKNGECWNEDVKPVDVLGCIIPAVNTVVMIVLILAYTPYSSSYERTRPKILNKLFRVKK